jgi:hypothetical protein
MARMSWTVMALQRQRLALRRIDAAQADHADVLRLHRRDERRVPAGKTLAAGDVSHRHAVQIAAGRAVEGVEVGMGVEPQHEQLFAVLLRPAGDAGDRAGGKTVVAAEKDRKAFRRRFVGGRLDRRGPGGDLAEIADGGIGMALRRDGADGDRRTLDHRVAEVAQRLGEAGGAEGARPHVGAAPAGAGFDGGGDENAGRGPRHASPPCANRAQLSRMEWRNEQAILAK